MSQVTSKNPLLLSSVQQCKVCPMLGEDHVPSFGSPHADLMIIGQSPGVKEVEKREAFVGPSGDLLQYMLDEAGLTKQEVYIANVLKCHPAGNRPADPAEIKCCKEIWLNNEIKAVDPRIILLLGKDAWRAILPRGRVDFSHMAECKSKKRQYLISYHPGYFLRQSKWEGFYQTVGRRVAELMENLI